MDPISIISLVGTRASPATKVVTTAGQIDEFLRSYRGADRSVASLSTTLRLFGESLTQMRSWLEKEPAVSQNLRRTIKGSVDDCEVVLEDLEEHVASVLRSANPRNGGSALGSLGLGRKMKHIWNASTVAKHEARLNSQVQTVMHLINFVKLNNTDQQDFAVDTAETRTIISKSANDAEVVRSLRDGSTIHDRDTAYTNVGDFDKEFEIDEELIRSPAYLAQYRALLQDKSSSSSKEASTTHSSGYADDGNSLTKSFSTLPGKSHRRPGTFSLKSLTWSTSSKSRKLVGHLCRAAQTGNVKWIESLLEEGAYINGWAIDDDEWLKRSALAGRTPGEFRLRRTPLIIAAMNKRHDAFRCLLDRGANLHAKDSEGCAVWNYLVAHDPAFCTQLMQSNIHPPPEIISSLLCQAVHAENVDLLKSLLADATSSHLSHESIDASGFNSKTIRGSILYRATQKGSLKMVKQLGDKGANVEEAPARVTVSTCEAQAEIEFLAHGNNQAPTLLFTIVGDIAKLDMVKYLVSKGARINAKTGCRANGAEKWNVKQDVTPLHLARCACAEFLISNGANVFAVDEDGRTPLFWAINMWEREPDWEAVLANLAHDSPANLEDHYGIRPLYLVAEKLLDLAWVSSKTLEIYLDVVVALRNAGAQSPDIASLPRGIYAKYLDAHRRLEGVRYKVTDYALIGQLMDERYPSKDIRVYGLFISSRMDWETYKRNGGYAKLRAHDGGIISGQVQLADVSQLTSKTQMLWMDEERVSLTSKLSHLCDLLLS